MIGFKRFLRPFLATSIAAVLAGTTPSFATPYCEKLLNPDEVPEKYASLAPVYSSQKTGWIFAQNQLRDQFQLKEKPKAIMAEIIAEFEARDIRLAILIAPPRPVVAGQGVLRKTMGEAAKDYDSAAALQSFQEMLTDLRQLGAVVPDLAALALSDPELRRRYYFRRDTHWTTVGAAQSAVALADEMTQSHPELVQADGPAILGWQGSIEERGSLADLVRNSCERSMPVEIAKTPVLADNTAGSLLGDGPDGPAVALVGTSFSDRYKRDHYRVADAVAAALGRPVDNFSVSGGGLHRAMQGFLKSDALQTGEYDLVVWEFPYTQNFNSTKRLGAVLKALRAAP